MFVGTGCTERVWDVRSEGLFTLRCVKADWFHADLWILNMPIGSSCHVQKGSKGQGDNLYSNGTPGPKPWVSQQAWFKYTVIEAALVMTQINCLPDWFCNVFCQHVFCQHASCVSRRLPYQCTETKVDLGGKNTYWNPYFNVLCDESRSKSVVIS